MKRIHLFGVALIAAMLFTALAATAQASHQIPVVTGEHWQSSTQAEQRAFLLGFATAVELEKEVQGKNPGNCETLVQSWVKGLSPHTLQDINQKVDKWYADHPGELQTPVIKALWQIFVDPVFVKK